jgi:hypothetical protein
VLLRFLTDLSAFVKKDCSELFHEVRYNVRFKDAMNIVTGDAEAVSADSTADLLMIEVVGSCFISYGFTILRALAIWRQHGGLCARGLSLYAILRSTTLKNQLTALVHLLLRL